MHTFNYPYTIPQALLAEKVCTTIGMDKIFFPELRYRGK
jgi:acetylornithine/N-succinyldiaminopimelate aminotransferase